MLSLVILIILLFCIKEKLFNTKTIIGLSILILLNSILIYRYNIPTFIRKTEDPAGLTEARIYSSNEKNINYYHNNSDFIIKKIDINVDTSRCLEVDGEFTFEITKDTKDLIFTLYKGYKIKSIKSNSTNLEYEQEEHQVYIKLDKMLTKGESVVLYIDYEGISPQIYYSGDKAVLLPANFPWIPYPADTQIFYPSYSEPVPLLNSNTIDFTIKYKGNSNFVSNLNTNDKTLSGEAYGVNLIAGNFYRFKNNDIYYISSKYDIPKCDLINYSNKLIEHINNIAKSIGLEEYNFKNIYYIDSERYRCYGNYLGDSQIIDDTLLSTYYDFANYDFGEDEGYITEAFAAILTSNNELLYQEQNIVDVFYNLFITWYVKNNNIEPVNVFYPDSIDKDKIDYMNKRIEDLSKDEVVDFFSKVYKMLSSNNKIDMNTIENCLDSINN